MVKRERFVSEWNIFMSGFALFEVQYNIDRKKYPKNIYSKCFSAFFKNNQ